MDDKPRLIEGMYGIDHDIFKGAVFIDRDSVMAAAKKFCRFLMASSGVDEATVDILKYATDEGSDGRGVRTDWWYHHSVSLRIIDFAAED